MASRGSVLIIVENLPVPFDRRVWMESTTLKRAGYEVSVICPAMKGFPVGYEMIEGIHVYRHPLPPEKSSALGYFREYAAALWHEWRLARRIYRERGFEVIHACNPPDLIFLVAWWFKLFHRTKFIFDHHDLNPELFESKFNKRGVFYHVLRLAERLTFWTADHVISTNLSYKEVAMTRGKKLEGEVTVVRSGPDLTRFQPVAPTTEFHHGRSTLVAYVGVMGEFDGVDHLVRAAAEVVHHHGRRDVQFCFIGGGPMLEELKKLAAELKILDFVEFTGRVGDQDLIARLSSCDIGVCPDPPNPLNVKSTMNKILEYMAMGKPVVQYDLVEGRRSAEDASVYATPGDVKALAARIVELADDPVLRAKLGNRGRERMEGELEWKYQAPRLIGAYESTLGQ